MHGRLKDKIGLFEGAVAGGSSIGEGGGGTPPAFLLLENGDYFNLEGGTDRLAIAGSAPVQPSSISEVTTAALADIALMTNSPAASAESQQATITRILNAINLLTAAGVLDDADVIPIVQSSVVTKATLQKLFNASSLVAAPTLPLTGAEFMLLHQDGDTDAKKISLETITLGGSFIGENVTDGWVIKGATIGTDAVSVTPLGDPTASSVNGTGGTSARVTTTSTCPPSLLQTSGNASGNYGGVNGTAQFTLARQSRFMCVARLNSTANVRFWCGLFEDPIATIAAGGDGIGGTTDWCGFRYSTGASDPAFMYTYGTAGSGSFLTTGVGADTNLHLFEFRRKTSGLIDFYIDRVLVATDISVTTSTGAVLRMVVGVVTLTGTNKTMNYCAHRVWQRT